MSNNGFTKQTSFFMSLCNTIEQKLNQPDLAYLLLRMVFGGAIILFGIQKLMGGSATFEQIGGSMAYFGVTKYPALWGFLSALAETFGGIFIVLGVLFRPAALALFFNMVVACTFMFKLTGSPDLSSIGALTGWIGKVSMPVAFCTAFLALFFTGAGKYAVRMGGGGGGGKRSKSKGGSE